METENKIEQQQKQIEPKDFFFNLALLVTLYGSIISLLNVLFSTINRVFPDGLSYYYTAGYSSGIRWSIAWLIVVFPIFLIITRHLHKIYVLNPFKGELWIRKWMVYLTLFLASVVVVVDLIVVINSFLGGELTTRFLLKILVTLAVAGLVFGYYFYDLKTEGRGTGMGKVFAITAVLFVIGSLVWAFSVIGSPMNERKYRFDEQRISHLQDIQWRITEYWQINGALPQSLDQLTNSISGYNVPKDPETGNSYEYNVIQTSEMPTSGKIFNLCANFNLNSLPSAELRYSKYYQVGSNDFWVYEKGRNCFERTIDEKLYPVKNPTAIPIR